MRITLTGDLGSGKSSVGRILSDRMKAPHYSAGSLFREIGHIQNLDALNTNLAAEDNADIDRQVDERTREIDRTIASFVIDSRMAWHFVTRAIKVYLSVSPRTAAERIVADKTRATEAYESVDAAVVALDRRRESEIRRYKKLYGVDISDPANYDLFIVTDDARVEDVAATILAFAEGRTSEKSWLPKRRIVPMVPAEADISAASANGALPIWLSANFGFFFGNAGRLLAALRSPAPLVPFVASRPHAVKEGADAISLARRSLDAADLTAWEEASGQLFAFWPYLESGPETGMPRSA